MVVAEKYFYSVPGETVQHDFLFKKKKHIHRFGKISSTQLNIQSKATAFTVSLNLIAFHIPQHQWQQSHQHRLVATDKVLQSGLIRGEMILFLKPRLNFSFEESLVEWLITVVSLFSQVIKILSVT